MHYLIEATIMIGGGALFLLQVESLGFLMIALLSKLTRNQSGRDTKIPHLSIRIAVGLLGYAMVWFGLGVFHFLSQTIVLVVTALIPVVVTILFKRYRHWSLKGMTSWWHELWSEDQRYQTLGILSFLVIGGLFALRPITQFDGLWYHLAFPKIWLQEHNIDFLGSFSRYSVHPYLDFFWNLWPFSLPLTNPLRGFIIGGTQLSLVTVALSGIQSFGKKYLSWSRWIQFIAPLSIGCTFEAIGFWYGQGYNDLSAMAFSLIAVPSLFHLSRKEHASSVSAFDLGLSLLLITGVGLQKFPFAIFAFVLLLWWWFGIVVPTKKMKSAILLLAGIGALFVMPWFVRAWIATGLPLYPVGDPALMEQALSFNGPLTLRSFLIRVGWERMFSALPWLIAWHFTPLLIIGVISIGMKSIRERMSDLWVVAIIAFPPVYFGLINPEARFFFPHVALLIILALSVLDEWSHATSAFSSFIFKALPVLSLIVVLILVRGTPHSALALYIIKQRTLDQYLSERNGQWNQDYYLSENSPRPVDLETNEMVLISNLHNIGFIEWQVLDPRFQGKYFANIETPEEFFARVKARGVRYALAKLGTLKEACDWVGIKNPEQCNDPKYAERVVEDTAQSVLWYKLK